MLLCTLRQNWLISFLTIVGVVGLDSLLSQYIFESSDLVPYKMSCRAILLNIELFGVLEQFSVTSSLFASQLLSSEVWRHVGVSLGHVTTQGLGLLKGSVMAVGADEKAICSEILLVPSDKLGLTLHFVMAGILLDLLWRGKRFRNLNEDLRVDRDVFLLYLF